MWKSKNLLYKYVLIIFLLTSCVGSYGDPNIITAKYPVSDTIYMITSYKDSPLYLNKDQYDIMLKTNMNNLRLKMILPEYCIILDGDSKNKIFVDEYTYNSVKEGQKYKK